MRRLLLGVWVLAGPCLALAYPAQDHGAWAAQIGRALAASQGEKASDRTRLERELEKLGPGVAPALVQLLACGTLPDSEDVPTLSEQQELAVLAVLRRFPESAAVRHARLLADDPMDRADPVALLRVLGAAGRLADIQLAVELAAPAESLGPAGHEMTHAFRSCLQQVLRRHGGPRVLASSRVLECGPVLQQAFVDVIGRFPEQGGIEFLCKLLGKQDALTGHVLIRLVQCTTSVRQLVEAEALEQLRSVLRADTVAHLCLAAQVLSALECGQAAQGLVELLDHRHPQVVAAAERALSVLGACDFKGNHARWRSWIKAEQAWFETRRSTLVAALRAQGEDLASALAASAELSEHPLYRDALTRELLASPRELADTTLALACGTVGRLGARSSASGLLELLEAHDESVRHAAWQGLRRVTKLELPMDSASWQQTLFQRPP